MKMTFSEWLAGSELGQYLLAREQAYYDQVVADAFGFHAVQLGLVDQPLLRANRIACQVRVDAGAGDLRADFAQLPFATRSIDLILLPHTLDFTGHPHQVLREAARVLVPEGRLIVTGFNPFSFWGARRLLQGSARAPWSGRFLRLGRMKDWLKLLGLEPMGAGYMAYAPPFNRGDWLARFGRLETAGERWWPLAAGVYGIEAVKRERGMRLITPAWMTHKKAAGLAVAGQADRHPAPPLKTDEPTHE